MIDELRRPVAVAAMVGFAASLVWHIVTLLGHHVPSLVSGALFFGIFVVFFPTVLYLQRFNAMFSGWGIGGWHRAFRGAPVWMMVVTPVAFVYAMVNFFLATGHTTGEVTGKDPAFDRVASGHALIFYGVAMLVMTAAVRREELGLDWRCEGGHALPPDGKFCAQCGAPARRTAAAARSAALE